MMFRKIFWIVLVIILVCLNWFDRLVAQDLSGLSEADRAELLRRVTSNPRPNAGVNNYQSAPIFEDSTPTAILPNEATDQPQSVAPNGATAPFESLQPFGTELFAGPRETEPPNDIAAAADYLLGPGDQLVVQIWGQAEKEYALTVDREGTVFLPQAGKINAWGQTLADFESGLHRKLRDVYSDFQLNVTLGKIRSIRIYLTGEVRHPGAYTVSSLTSLYNALYLAGGPNENGSMRAIRLMRNGQRVDEVDLYRFLLEGDNSSDIRMESGDAIFVPMAGTRVAIRGNIHRPAIYELVADETAADLLALAGNPMADAYLKRVMLERVSGSDEWNVLDLNLSPDLIENDAAMVMTDGDRMTVFSVYELKRNMVAAFGLVRHPGYYERNEATRISDLIERAQLQPYDVHFKRANLFRRHGDFRREVFAIDLTKIMTGSEQENIMLEDGDSLHVYSMRDLGWDRYIQVDGEVQNPGRYQYYDNMTVEDAIFLAGSFRRGASQMRAEIARTDTLGEVTVEEINLGNPTARQKILTEDDRIYVRQLPHWQLHRTVRIDGEVMYPGEYVLASREETLFHLVQRAGGLTRTAFPKGMIVERTSIGIDLDRKKIPSLLERTSPLVQDSLGNINRQILFDYEPNSMNRIVLDVDQLLETGGAKGDIVLEPGDKIFIPQVPSGISVLGAVGSSGTINFAQGKKAKSYIERAGNFTSQADKGATRLIRANGEVYSGGGTLGKRVELGDIIVVPTKIRKERNLTRTFTTALTAVTGVLTTVLLIDRL